MIEVHVASLSILDTLDIVTDDVSNITVSEVIQGRIVPAFGFYDMVKSRISSH